MAFLGNYTTNFNGDILLEPSGEANDDIALQSAINAVGAAGGGLIRLAPRLFKLSAALTISASDVIIEGSGTGTVLQLQPNVNPANGILNITGTSVVSVQLRRFKIDGNYTNNSSGAGIYINTPLGSSGDSQHVLEDVELWNCAGHGVDFQQGTQVQMTRCRARYNRQRGFNLNASDSHFSDLIADTNQYDGIYAGTYAGHFKDCKTFYNGQAGAFYAGIYINAYNSYLVNCEAEDNYNDGFVINSPAHACILNNCIGDSNGQTSGNGLTVYGNNNVIMGGAYYERDFPPSWTQKIGISFVSTATGNVVIGPAVYSNANSQIADTSSGTNIVHLPTGSSAPVVAGTTKTTPGTVSKWITTVIGGTTYYIPAYSSTTA